MTTMLIAFAVGLTVGVVAAMLYLRRRIFEKLYCEQADECLALLWSLKILADRDDLWATMRPGMLGPLEERLSERLGQLRGRFFSSRDLPHTCMSTKRLNLFQKAKRFYGSYPIPEEGNYSDPSLKLFLDTIPEPEGMRYVGVAEFEHLKACNKPDANG